VPGGMVEAGEPDPGRAALRELEEETGFTAAGSRRRRRSAEPGDHEELAAHVVAIGARRSVVCIRTEGEEIETFEPSVEEVDEMVGTGDHACAALERR